MASRPASPPAERSISLRAVWRRAALAVVLFWGPFVAWQGSCITGLLGWSTRGVELLVLVAPLAGLAVVAAGFTVLLSTRLRDRALQVVLIGCVLLLTFVPAVALGGWLRMSGFAAAGERAAPMVAAIERCIAETGAVPKELGDLVPRWIESLPARLPPLTIVTADERTDLGANRWALWADVPRGFINWDVFLYFPDQQYPDRGWGGSLQRLGRWAYVHE